MNSDVASASSSNGLKTIQLNDQKAGMQGVDKESINKIIFEASKGTPYFSFQEKRQQRIDHRVKEMLAELQKASDMQRKESLNKMDSLISSLETERDLTRSIVHIDMDAFYAAVEMRDNPDLKSKPMAVGGSSMLSTSNYEARRFGVRAAMPGFIAKKLCPELVIVPCNFDKYRSVSKQIKAIVREYDPNSYAASLDEMYLDVTNHVYNMYRKEKHNECCDSHNFSPSSQGQFSNGSTDKNCEESSNFANCRTCDCYFPDSVRDELAFNVVNEIRSRIFETTQLTASAGIAPNTMLAKVCSDQNKPNGQYQVLSNAEEVKKFIKTLPVKKISGIGPVQSQLLNALGIYTCTDLYSKRELVNLLFSPTSVHFYMRVALGLGSTVVKSDYVRKSIGTEVTFGEIHKSEDLYQKCQDLCCEITEDLKSRHLMGKVVVLKIKTVNFDVHTRNATLPCYTSDGEAIMMAAKRLLDGEIRAAAPAPLKLRLMGVRMANLVDESEVASGKQAKLENFLQPKSGSTSQVKPEVTSASTSDCCDKFVCPVCDTEHVTNLSSFNRHVNQCLQISVDKKEHNEAGSSKESNDEHFSEVKCETYSAAQTTETEADKELCSSGLLCPVCGLEQRLSTLADLNAHIDNCLSRCAIKELLSTDACTQIGDAKRKSSFRTKNGKKIKSDGRTSKTLDQYFR